MFQRGYWTIGHIRGAAVRFHWSVPVAALVLSRFQWSPGFFVAYPCLVLIHELGHAYLAWQRGHTVTGVLVSGLGGVCQWSGNSSPFDEALIAWGGVLAQLVVFGATHLWLGLVAEPSTLFGWQVVSAFTSSNLYLIAVNLMPIPPLDGARAWGIFAAFRDRGAKGVPSGTWRDPSANAQDAWFKSGRGRPAAGSGKARPARTTVNAAESSEASDDGTLSAENQQAIDELLRNVTKKRRAPSKGE